jgi:hypothetical protein
MGKIFLRILFLLKVVKISFAQNIKNLSGNNYNVIICSKVNFLNIFQRGYIFLSNFNKYAFRIYKIIQNEIYTSGNAYFAGDRRQKTLIDLAGIKLHSTNNIFHKIEFITI